MNGLVMLGLWTLVAAAIALFVGWVPTADWMNRNQALAGWVQAIFSVVAIAATGVYAARQMREARAHDARVEARKMLAMTAVVRTLTQILAAEINSRASRLTDGMDARAIASFSGGDPFVDISEAVTAIPIHEQPEIAQVRLVFALRSYVRMTKDAHSAVARELTTPLGDFLVARQPFFFILSGMADLEQQCIKREAQLALRC